MRSIELLFWLGALKAAVIQMINEDIRLNISLWFCNLKTWYLKIVQRYSFSLFDACTYPVSMTHFVLRENHIWRDM